MSVPVARNPFAEKGHLAISVTRVAFAVPLTEQVYTAATVTQEGGTHYFRSRGCSWEFQESPERSR